MNRQEEILCFSEYVLQLRSWVALGSDVFALEIEQALRWPTELRTASLSKGAQVRSARLLAILQQVFASYPRADMLLRAYVEGVGADGVYQIHRGTSGFEALRILGKEFSLRSRAEASFFRAEVLKKSFRGESNATAVSDIVRKLDVEPSRYRKLVEIQLFIQGTALRSNRQTLPSFCCVSFLQVQGTTSCSTRRMRVFRRSGPRLCGMKGNRGCSWSLDQVLRHDMSTKWLLIPMSTNGLSARTGMTGRKMRNSCL